MTSTVMISIERRCREQQATADRIFMDFKYTEVGSIEQIQAIESFQSSIVLWFRFFLDIEDSLVNMHLDQSISV